MSVLLIFTIIVFLLGIYFIYKTTSLKTIKEGLEDPIQTQQTQTSTPNPSITEMSSVTPSPIPSLTAITPTTTEIDCPNMLLQIGSKLYLYNSKKEKVKGKNPIVFENLEDYVEFLKWQRRQNIRCPVLYLQQMNDAQGNNVYKIRPCVTEPQGGLPPYKSEAISLPNFKPSDPNPSLLIDATQDNSPYNKNSYPAFDPSRFYVGVTTPLDLMNVKSKQQDKSANPMDPNWGGPEYTQEMLNKGYYKGNEVSIMVQ